MGILITTKWCFFDHHFPPSLLITKFMNIYPHRFPRYFTIFAISSDCYTDTLDTLLYLSSWNNSNFKENLLHLFSTPKLRNFGLYHRPSSGLWYRPKYCIFGVRNKWSRFSLKFELFQQFLSSAFNTKYSTLSYIFDIFRICIVYFPLIVYVSLYTIYDLLYILYTRDVDLAEISGPARKIVLFGLARNQYKLITKFVKWFTNTTVS